MMKIYVPPSIKHYTPELRFFFDNMVRKLAINRHKGFAEGTQQNLFMKMEMEVTEMVKAIDNEGQFEAAMEAVDVANMAWLNALKILGYSKDEWEKMQKEQKR